MPNRPTSKASQPPHGVAPSMRSAATVATLAKPSAMPSHCAARSRAPPHHGLAQATSSGIAPITSAAAPEPVPSAKAA